MSSEEKSHLRHVRLWACIHTFLITALAFLIIRGDYEERVFRRLVERTVQPSMSRQEAAIAITDRVHELTAPRREVYGESLGGPFAVFFSSFTTQLNAPDGQCGSASAVLAKALQAAGYRVRYAQMKVQDVWGGHIMVETEVEPGHWAVLGPTFGVHLLRPDGKLASFADVQKNCSYYASQFPSGYNFLYCFEDVRYTNWDKIPVVMPAARAVLACFLSPETLRTFCLRAFITNYYYLNACILGAIYAGLLLARHLWTRRRVRQPLWADSRRSLPVPALLPAAATA